MISYLLLGQGCRMACRSDSAGMELPHASSMETPSVICQVSPNDNALGKTLQCGIADSSEAPLKTFGQRLRHARDEAEITQEQLGFEVGVSKASISAWENDRERPSFDNLPKLQAVLRISLDHLIVGGNSEGVKEDGAEWSTPAKGNPKPDAEAAATSEEPDDLATVVQAMSYCQTFVAQALAATIPTAACDVLGALDNKLPQHLHETGYIQTLRKTILGQLSRNSMLSRRAATPKAPSAPQRKRR